MDGRYVLDTNIVIALFAEDEFVRSKLAQSNEVFVPSVVLGELYFGAAKSGRPIENLGRVSEFALTNRIIPCNQITALRYGQLKKGVREKGRLIPENDLWIAAIALQHRLTLVSRDKHFVGIEGLQIESW